MIKVCALFDSSVLLLPSPPLRWNLQNVTALLLYYSYYGVAEVEKLPLVQQINATPSNEKGACSD